MPTDNFNVFFWAINLKSKKKIYNLGPSYDPQQSYFQLAFIFFGVDIMWSYKGKGLLGKWNRDYIKKAKAYV